MEDRPPDEQFVQALTTSQGRLLAYIFCLLGNWDDANSVLQETNLVIWRKFKELESVRYFNSWSREVAYFQSLAFLRDRKRDKLLFSQEVIDKLVIHREQTDFDERRLALRHCLAKLPGDKREIIRRRYAENKRVAQIAAELEKSEGAVKMALKRIRFALMDCINRRLEMVG